jgi:cytochrome c
MTLAHLERALLAAVMMAAASACARPDATSVRVAGADPARGAALIDEYGCNACHTVPGVRNATRTVGPPLGGWSHRAFIAGEVPNTAENLIRWIELPQGIEPNTAMPNLGVSARDARDIAAYLYTLR